MISLVNGCLAHADETRTGETPLSQTSFRSLAQRKAPHHAFVAEGFSMRSPQQRCIPYCPTDQSSEAIAVRVVAERTGEHLPSIKFISFELAIGWRRTCAMQNSQLFLRVYCLMRRASDSLAL